MTAILIVLILVVIALAAGIFLILRHYRRKVAALADEQRSAQMEKARSETRMINEHHEKLSLKQSEHEKTYAKFQADREVEISELRSELEIVRTDKKKIAHQLRNVFNRSDLTSRRRIVDACRELNLDAVLLTNITFSPEQDRSEHDRYYSQADHMIVSERGLAVIESKHWSMMVFDGVDAANQLPPLKPILQDAHLEPGEVLHIWDPDSSMFESVGAKWRERNIAMQVRKSPHSQVRNHARRLNELLSSRIRGAARWIDTCVFYSYSGAEVHHVKRSGNTSVVSDDGQLKHFLTSVALSGQRKIDVPQVVQALQRETGDITGIGEWQKDWPSVLS